MTTVQIIKSWLDEQKIDADGYDLSDGPPHSIKVGRYLIIVDPGMEHNPTKVVIWNSDRPVDVTLDMNDPAFFEKFKAALILETDLG